MDSSQAQNWMHAIRPNSGSSQSFEDIPLSPLPDEDQPSNASSGFVHVPLEHELVASRSVWDDSAIPDELDDHQSITSMKLSEEVSPAAAAKTPREGSLTAVDGQAQFCSEVEREPEQEEPGPTSAVLNSPSDLTLIPDQLTSSIASTETLVERTVATDTISGSSIEIPKFPFSTEPSRDQNSGPSISVSDISDDFSTDRPTGSADLTISTPPAKVLGHTPFSRASRPEPSPLSPIPQSFEIPIPIFPFAAGTTRCTDRKCPIKHRHEQGPYLHEGKLRSREGAMFGSSNPPPELWFLYDTWREESFCSPSAGSKALAPVQLFAKFHFGETRGEDVCRVEGPESGRQGVKMGGKMARFWRFWG